MPIEDIFKVPIYSTTLNLDIKALQIFCRNNQVDGLTPVQNNNDLQPLVNEIEKHSTIFSNSFINKKKQVIKDFWFNINFYKDFNKSHCHPLSILSGVFYVKTPKGCGEISFDNPAGDVLAYYNSYFRSFTDTIQDNNTGFYDSWNTYNAEQWQLPPIENKLYIFPSWLKHSVNSNQNKTEERIAFSFNTITK
jgi:uncharacterized protein (TIGR02466 family)